MTRSIITIVSSIAILILILFCVFKSFIIVDAGETAVVQDPFDGQLHVYTSPGVFAQNFGKVTFYKKQFSYEFSKFDHDKDSIGRDIKIRFNDGGHAQISGTVNVILPSDEKSMREIHTLLGSMSAIEDRIIAPAITKAIYMTGPLMSSTESYAEKRNDLIFYIDDQATHGVYKTKQKDIRVQDPLTGTEKSIKVVDIVLGANNLPLRQEKVSTLERFNLALSGLSISDVDYDRTVDNQIRLQQQALGNVQTAMSNAKKAEQDAITAEQQGKADAMKAKWEEEKLKIAAITVAEKNREVARLDDEAASFYKSKLIKQGQGEAEKKRLLQTANNSLEPKLDAMVKIHTVWAQAFKDYQGNITPSYWYGNGNAPNAATNWMELMNANLMKQLGTNLAPSK